MGCTEVFTPRTLILQIWLAGKQKWELKRQRAGVCTEEVGKGGAKNVSDVSGVLVLGPKDSSKHVSGSKKINK